MMDGNTWILRGIGGLGLLAATACDDAVGELSASELVYRQGSIVAGMSLGDGESWAVSRDGEVKGWGRRHCDSEGCREPLEIEALALPGPAVEVASNGSFTAVRLQDGAVLGLGPTLADAAAPVQIDLDDPAAGVAVGLDFLCARFDAGHVECRGLPGMPMPPELGAPSWLDDAVGITAGAKHACALRSEGDVVCWGRGDAEQLGPGVGVGSRSLTLSDPVAAVVAGGEHTCARLVTGKVACWGSNAQGQLGRPAGVVDGVVTVPLPEPAATLALGSAHTCASGAHTGGLYCWGSDGQGQLGKGVALATGIRHVDLGGLRATGVLAGATASTTFVTLETGGLRGFGDDDHGQTGYGDRFRDDGEPALGPGGSTRPPPGTGESRPSGSLEMYRGTPAGSGFGGLSSVPVTTNVKGEPTRPRAVLLEAHEVVTYELPQAYDGDDELAIDRAEAHWTIVVAKAGSVAHPSLPGDDGAPTVSLHAPEPEHRGCNLLGLAQAPDRLIHEELLR